MMALALLQAEAAGTAAEGLTPVSWIFMLGAMGAVIALTSWCFWRISRTREHFDPDGTGPAKPPIEGRVERQGGA